MHISFSISGIYNSFGIVKIFMFLGIFLFIGSCKNVNDSKGQNHTNHLKDETSAYLLAHAHNPVDWYPWGETALNKARNESKLMVISIGYSSCHWCHVMEREAFSDTAVSRIMNTHFVSIKVDREERPDIDNIYMTACQISNQDGGCGWPLNAITLPDGKPVWVGTYLKKDEWMNLLNQVNDLYHEDQNELQKMAYRIANHLQADHKFVLSDKKIQFEFKTLELLHRNLRESLDYEWGGRLGEMKFPLPSLLNYVMEYAHFSKDKKSADWLKTTLDKMIYGGIYDQLAGGFARYTTDPKWRIPHFEKMLYDNAQLISVYANAYKHTRSDDYKRTLEQTLDFMESDFSTGDGKYFSSFDAESEGVEGKYYVWSNDEIKKILAGDKNMDMVIDMYNISKSGNWENGKNVLIIEKNPDDISKKYGLKKSELIIELQSANQKLLQARKQRIAPKRDDKIIASWNALMVMGLADAYASLGDEKYLDRAIKTAMFLKNEMLTSDYRMYRTYMNGKKGEFAFLDDYAITIQAFIRLYEVSFDESWLESAKGLSDYVIKYFSDEEQVYFYYNSSLDPELIARKKEIADQVIPASNSIMCDVLHKLGLYYYNEDYITRSEQMLSHIIENPAGREPVFYANWLRIYIEFCKPLYEVAIVGADFKKLQKEMLSQYLPQAILLGGASEGSLELLKEKLQEGQTYIYVCRNKVCKLPVTEVAKAIELMK
jgi:uncharacterized protein